MCFCWFRDDFVLLSSLKTKKWNGAPRQKFWLALGQVLGSESQVCSCFCSFYDEKDRLELVYMLIDHRTHPTVMSKMLLPTELDTAMSPSPFLATMTLVIRSGIEVPAAKMVRPMISSLMPIVSPT